MLRASGLQIYKFTSMNSTHPFVAERCSNIPKTMTRRNSSEGVYGHIHSVWSSCPLWLWLKTVLRWWKDV